MVTLGQFPPTEAAMINHSAPRPVAPDAGVTIAYGEYRVGSTCSACHGIHLNGGYIRGLNGELAIALNLTQGSELAGLPDD
jgi:mono/diheme cytochrome c family protein